MGRLIYAMSVSLDGFVETPAGSLDWGLIDEELHTFFNDQSREISASLYGRRMYELMFGYWPKAEADPAATRPSVGGDVESPAGLAERALAESEGLRWPEPTG